MGGKKDEEFLKLNIDLPNFKLALQSNSRRSLMDVRRIVETLNLRDEDFSLLLEDPNIAELRSRLSEEFFQHQGLINRLKSSLVLDEDVRIVKRIMPMSQEVNLETGEQSRQVNTLGVKNAISALFENIETTGVRECLVHIRGELDREQQTVIMDAIKQHLGMDAQARFFSTRKNLEGKVLVEAVCFGERLSSVEF